jgi:hypothetical protein
MHLQVRTCINDKHTLPGQHVGLILNAYSRTGVANPHLFGTLSAGVSISVSLYTRRLLANWRREPASLPHPISRCIYICIYLSISISVCIYLSICMLYIYMFYMQYIYILCICMYISDHLHTFATRERMYVATSKQQSKRNLHVCEHIHTFATRVCRDTQQSKRNLQTDTHTTLSLSLSLSHTHTHTQQSKRNFPSTWLPPPPLPWGGGCHAPLSPPLLQQSCNSRRERKRKRLEE